MREIKFRYWNGVTKQMVLNPAMPFKEGWTIEQLFSDRGWVWMQFTGLLDRNGKEIYEGDVVRLESSTPMVVEFSKGAFTAGYIYGGVEAYRMEIIGNIYENPDLIAPNPQ